MIGYPKGQLTKVDYENLLSMPEFADRAKEDLEKLSSLDDSKIQVETGTAEKSVLKQIDNPAPAWKRAGFKDKKAVDQAIQDIKPEPSPIDPVPDEDPIVKKYKHVGSKMKRESIAKEFIG